MNKIKGKFNVKTIFKKIAPTKYTLIFCLLLIFKQFFTLLQFFTPALSQIDTILDEIMDNLKNFIYINLIKLYFL